MKLNQLDKFLIKTLFLCAAFIIMTQTLGYESLTSMLFLMTFPLTVLLWLRSVRWSLTGRDLLMMAAAALAVISVLLDLVRSNGSLSFSYVKKLIMFIMSLLFLQTASRLRVGQEIVKFIDRIMDMLTVYLLLMFLVRRNEMFLLNGYVTNYLTFRFSNPNTTGMFLTCMYMMELYRLFLPERWYIKLYHVILAGILAWFVIKTQSRNCLLVIFLFTLICGWLVLRSDRRMRITGGFAAFAAWFPLIFVTGYMTVINAQWVQRMFAFLIDAGKSLDSRMDIWMLALEHIGASPLIGSYYAVSEGTGNAQLHNSHLDIMVSYGIPVFVIVCVLLTLYLHKKGRCYEDKGSYIYILGFACAIMLGIGEAAVFSGGLGIYIYVGMFLLLSNRESSEE